MAAPSVTNTFTNGTTADATEVNQNFTDVINGITDGTKDLTISALTANGAAVFNGTVTLGNATGDDVTITGYVDSAIIPKTNATYDLGSSSLSWQAIYLDDGATTGGTAYFNAGGSSISSTADGTTLDINTFTSVDLNTTADIVGALHYYAAVNNGTIYDEGDPVYSFTGDTDTGMYSEAANQINFSTGGTLALTIDSSQDVTCAAGFNVSTSDTDGNVHASTWTPTISSQSGLDSGPSNINAMYLRVGLYIQATVYFEADATSAGAGASTNFEMTLPSFVSSITAFDDIIGLGQECPSNQAADGHASVRTVAGTNRVEVSMHAAGTSSVSWHITFAGFFVAA